MAAAQAHALVPGLAAVDADPLGDAAALARLAVWVQRRYAPVCAVDPPDGLALDATGATHLRGGDAAFLADLTGRLDRAGIAALAAIAPTYGAAHALARFAPERALTEDGGVGAALADLPLAALRLPPDLADALRRLGFETVLDLERQPRAPLTRRFGPEVGRRLDQAFGRLAEPLVPVLDETAPRVDVVFAEPISAPETLARHVGELVERLCARLEQEGKGARRLDLLCERVDGRIEAVRTATARPVRAPARLVRLLRDKIETIDPGFGVERMSLIAVAAEALDWTPSPSRLGDGPPPDLADLIDILSDRVGHARVYRLEGRESDVPERAARRVAPLAEARPLGWTPAWPRPVRLFRPPEPVQTLALLPDNPPTHFTWRGVRRRILRADGPERIHGEWGRSDAELWAVRDYFQVEDETGERFWLFRAGDGEDPRTGSQAWFIHGKFG